MNAEEIRNRYASKHGYHDWDDMMACEDNLNIHEDNVMEQYHQAKLKELLPSDEDIEDQFPTRGGFNNAIMDSIQMSARSGAMWITNKLKQDK